MNQMGRDGKVYFPKKGGIRLEVIINGEKVYRPIVQTNLAMNRKDRSNTHYRYKINSLNEFSKAIRITNPNYIGEARERIHTEIQKKFAPKTVRGRLEYIFGFGPEIEVREHQPPQNHKLYSTKS